MFSVAPVAPKAVVARHIFNAITKINIKSCDDNKISRINSGPLLLSIDSVHTFNDVFSRRCITWRHSHKLFCRFLK